MEKGMKRKVLFDKKSGATAAELNERPTKKEEPIIKEEAPEENETVSQSIRFLEWLKDHKLIKIKPMCKEAGIDPGTFHRWMNVDKEIPQHAIEKLTPILKNYGYNVGVQSEPHLGR